jgi:hypothetical protein
MTPADGGVKQNGERRQRKGSVTIAERTGRWPSVAAVLATVAWLWCFQRQALAASQGDGVRKAVEDIASGRGDVQPLAVTYDDLHALWGLRLTIRGTGQVGQKAVREKAGESRTVSREEIIQLAALLVRHAAWEQRVPERTALPDESRTSLTITYGHSSVTIWEWYNDVKTNHRIGDIGDFMKGIAWSKSGRSSIAPAVPPSERSRPLPPSRPS